MYFYSLHVYTLNLWRYLTIPLYSTQLSSGLGTVLEPRLLANHLKVPLEVTMITRRYEPWGFCAHETVCLLLTCIPAGPFMFQGVACQAGPLGKGIVCVVKGIAAVTFKQYLEGPGPCRPDLPDTPVFLAAVRDCARALEHNHSVRVP